MRLIDKSQKITGALDLCDISRVLWHPAILIFFIASGTLQELQNLSIFVACLTGNLNSNGNDLLVYGKQYGNVFIGVQPTFGYEGDPMRLLFSRSASPHHGFAAYYTYLEKVFKADAVLHFGTHGR